MPRGLPAGIGCPAAHQAGDFKMGGGDLNMKKSWHPLLMKNQERVWKEERKALEERKKTIQLQKELAEERQLQELQRIQAEQGGGHREERVEWLYATPAIGNGINAEEQEAYLLGKKTVDKLFKEKDEAAAKLAAQAASQADADKPGGGFISLQNANTARDIASKIREDPLLAIKQQEQLAYEALKKNPAKMKLLQSQNKTTSERKRDKEESKKQKREEKEERKRRHDADDCNKGGSRRDRDQSKRSRDDHYHPRQMGHRYNPQDEAKPPYRSSSHCRDHRQSHTNHHDRPPSPDFHAPRHHRNDVTNSASYPRQNYRDRNSPRRRYSPRNRDDSNSRYSHRHSPLHENRSRQSSFRADELSATRTDSQSLSNKLSESKMAKLAQMQAAAKSMQETRSDRVKLIEQEDQRRLREEEIERERNRIKSGGVGDGVRAKFVREEEKKVFFGNMKLEERVKRSGGFGLLKDRE
ncbi:hypothetical protein O181_040150 [Austropuccinia psidii MF-1]|uniref:CBF1-interacting co-repressor CIR N-terminal domain-containing protein n=1 Tax=Austropuccinia psidii MF-1 TaxID=1389203 RepID=A0A9Q3DG66_9BASI|nr:hypothetical protein [Austropuccinia psidii MF-1]